MKVNKLYIALLFSVILTGCSSGENTSLESEKRTSLNVSWVFRGRGAKEKYTTQFLGARNRFENSSRRRTAGKQRTVVGTTKSIDYGEYLPDGISKITTGPGCV